MKKIQVIIILILLNSLSLLAQEDDGLWDWTNRPLNLGQSESKYTRVKKFGQKVYYIDKIDDTKNYKLLIDNIYKDTANRIYIKTKGFSFPKFGTFENIDSTDNIEQFSDDTYGLVEYFKDYTKFFDLKTYRKINKDYFINKGKVYLWWVNSDGEFPILVKGADPNSFIPFKKIAGGIDKFHVVYGGPDLKFEILNDANPSKIKVLNPKRGCWNCGNCYFVDDKHVYFGTEIIESADSKSFRLVNLNKIDAKDKNHKYFEGKIINN